MTSETSKSMTRSKYTVPSKGKPTPLECIQVNWIYEHINILA